MWNKLFKKKQSKPSDKSQNNVTKKTPAAPSKCFSFRSGRKENGDHYKPNENFHYLQYESGIYKRPGEAECA